ncbi:MAG: biopolymer transporter ExbD [Myxococcales bacterium]
MSMTVGKKGVTSELNITPMIDILLVLLIIFMVMTPLMMMQHRVDVPKRAEVDLPPDISSDQTVLTFTKDGLLFLNQAKVDKPELGKVLTERFKDRREKTIFLNIDPDANYGESLRVIDVVRNSGLEKLAIVTQKEGEKFQIPGQGTAAGP